jgi:serine/threonine protein kinase
MPIYEIGLAGQIRYLVSLYAAGGSLMEKLSEGPLEAQEVLRHAAEIAAALEYLHNNGIIHRDLKTSNILSDLKHHVYLADFGIAHFFSVTTQALHTGRGTSFYAPPEQLKMGAMSPQSDIYSYGLTLYELFTGELPWAKEAPLSIRQLSSSDEELPDPREINSALPTALAEALRQMTSVNPGDRPHSASEALKMLCQAFGTQPINVFDTNRDEKAILRDDARELLEKTLPQWESPEVKTSLSLTKYSLVNLYLREANTTDFASKQVNPFMLHHALTFGYDDTFWWAKVTDRRERLEIAGRLLNANNDSINTRILNHLSDDQGLNTISQPLPQSLVTGLLGWSANTSDPSLRKQALRMLRKLIPPSKVWHPVVFDPQKDQTLAQLALDDTDYGEEAAQLIGHLHSELALQHVVSEANNNRRTSVLIAIQKVAGNLPHVLSPRIRGQVIIQWLLHQLFDRPLDILTAYGMVFLGNALGFALQTYLTYRLPVFMDTTRILLSMERGAILGIIISLGILVARLIVERFPKQKSIPRLFIAVLCGGVLLELAFFSYDYLILNNPPSGFLVTAGCFMIALGYAIGALNRSRPWKILISAVMTFLAFAGSWWGNLQMLGSPLLYYEISWSLTKILVTMFLVTIPMAILGNLQSLAPRED